MTDTPPATDPNAPPTSAEAGPAPRGGGGAGGPRLLRTLHAFPALDGLRGVAILLVMAFHLGLPWHALPGGFLGVDLFFVLSGFLITSLLLRELGRTRRIDFGRFYARRARRLLPALALLLVPLALAGCVAFALRGRTDVLWSVSAGAFYWGNWLHLTDVNTFSPMWHVWSLAIEEQYYVVWPLLLLGAVRARSPRVAILLGTLVLAAGSAVSRAVVSLEGGSVDLVSYATWFRLDGILLGSALAMAFAWYRADRLARWSGALAPAAVLGLVVLSAVLGQFATGTFVWGMVAAELCAAVLIASIVFEGGRRARGARLVQLGLLAPVLLWFGRRSYALYLFTWPAQELLHLPAAAEVLLVPLICLPLAEVSYRYLERPVLERRFLDQTWVAGPLRRLRLRRPAAVPERMSAPAPVPVSERVAAER